MQYNILWLFILGAFVIGILIICVMFIVHLYNQRKNYNEEM